MTITHESAGGSSESGLTVYVIDDDRSMRRSLERLLKVSDWSVRTFDSAEAFLAALDRTVNGFLIIDIQLPGMNGLDLLQRARDMRLHWPAVAMSGSNDESVEREALCLGAMMFLHKPFDPQALLDALEQTASGRRKADSKVIRFPYR